MLQRHNNEVGWLGKESFASRQVMHAKDIADVEHTST
jgi:hypothetical protein